MRDLMLQPGRYRTLVANCGYAHGVRNHILFRTSGNTTVDPSITRVAGQAIPTWHWDDGASSSGDSVSHTYSGAGDYGVRGVVKSSGRRCFRFGAKKDRLTHTPESNVSLPRRPARLSSSMTPAPRRFDQNN